MQKIKLYKFQDSEFPVNERFSIVTLNEENPVLDNFLLYREAYYCIFLLAKGEAEIQVNEFKSKIKAPEVVCGLPGDLWEWKWRNKPEGYFLCFDASFALSCFKANFQLEPLPYFNPETRYPFIRISEKRFQRLLLLVKDMIECRTELPVYFDLLRSELWTFLFLLEKEYILNGNKGRNGEIKNHINKFINLVNEHFQVHHDTKFYAEQMNITTNYLNKICNALLGVKAFDYIMNRIMSEARFLLRLSNTNVNEIAYKLGFENPNYFIRCFKKMEKMTPGEYRKQGTL